MPPTSVPPSKKNPVGSFDDTVSDDSTESPTIINKNDANDSEQDDTVNAVTDHQELSDDDDNHSDGSSGSATKAELESFLQQRKATSKKASTEKEFQQLLMDIFRKVQDCQYTGLLSTSGILATDEQKSEISDYINDYIFAIQNNDNDSANTYKDAEMIWTLFLMLFESKFTGKEESVVGEFRNWIDTYLPLDLTQLYSDADIDWGFGQRLVLNGDRTNAAEYFEGFTDRGPEYNMLSTIISNAPEPPTSLSTSFAQSNWTEDWDRWHGSVVSLWNDMVQKKLINEDDTTSGLVLVMKLMMGDSKTIQKTGTFGQKCLATLLYTDPRTHQFNMEKIANQVYDPILDGDATSVLIYNMLDGDFDPLLGSLDDTLWMQAHFGHLLLVTGYIPSEVYDGLQNDSQEQVTEPIYYVLKFYASDIAKKYCMWTEAIECIMMCRSNRTIWIKELLGEPPLASEDLDYVKEVLEFCKEHKLKEIESLLYSTIAKRHQANNDYVCAATNYADAHDIEALDKLAMQHLDLYLTDGILQPVVTESKYIKLVDQSHPYSFYRRYYEVKYHAKEMENDESYQTTVALLQSLEYVPQKYRAVLLVDLFGLTNVYSSTRKQDYLLMLQQLDQVVNDADQKAFMSSYYERTHSSLSVETIIERLRQRFGFCFAADMLSL